jgi:hypothetical protein
MPKKHSNPRRKIATLNEKPLHAALKEWYRQPGDRAERAVDGFFVDLVRGGLLIEIQTRNLAAIRRKVEELARRHPVRVVYPIAQEKWIVRRPADSDKPIGRRKSPRRGSLEDVFEELVSMPRLLAHPRLSLEVLMIQEEEVRRYDPGRAWRRRHWVTEERRLVGVLHGYLFQEPLDLRALLPDSLAEPFTTADMSRALGCTRHRAQQMAYCLREMGEIAHVGRQRDGILYERAAA